MLSKSKLPYKESLLHKGKVGIKFFQHVRIFKVHSTNIKQSFRNKKIFLKTPHFNIANFSKNNIKNNVKWKILHKVKQNETGKFSTCKV